MKKILILILGIFFSILGVFAVGFHQASEILPGQFSTGDFSFDGNIGIGTSSPSSKLDVGGTIRSTSQTIPTSGIGLELVYYNNQGYLSTYDRTAGHFLPLNLNGGDVYIENGTGNVGIGTSSPDAKLDIEGITFSNTEGINHSLQLFGRFGFRFETSDSTMLLDRYNSGAWQNPIMAFNRVNGNVGIGTTNPTEILVIGGNGKLKFSGHDNTGLIDSANHATIFAPDTKSLAFVMNNDGGSDRFSFIVDPDNVGGADTEVMVIKGNSYVGIGTITPAQKLDVHGNIAVSGVTVHTSDIRLKQNITNNTQGLNEIKQLNSVNYYWIDKNISKEKQIGFIAQEVEQIIPDLVLTNNETSFKSLNYEGVIPVLVNAIQEQQKLIENLTENQFLSIEKFSIQQTEIEQQNNKINQLEQDIIELKELLN